MDYAKDLDSFKDFMMENAIAAVLPLLILSGCIVDTKSIVAMYVFAILIYVLSFLAVTGIRLVKIGLGY